MEEQDWKSLIETLVISGASIIVALVALIRGRGAKQGKKSGDGPKQTSIATKDDLRDLIDLRLKENVPALLKENIPCFRKEDDCAVKVRETVKRDVLPSLKRIEEMVHDVSRRVYDTQRRIAGRNPEMPTEQL